jgi:DNA polymerase III alpha subunit (gram-positive type)
MDLSKILVIDIETTGFTPASDLIVEVGGVLLNLETGKIHKAIDVIVREKNFGEGHKKSWIFENSDLDWDRVFYGDSFEKHIKKIQGLLDKYYVVSWNTAFDFKFLKHRGLSLWELKCPMKASAKFFKLNGKHAGSYKWASVQEAWDLLFPNSKYTERHRAYDDAAHEAKIIHELIKKGGYICQNSKEL